MADPRTAFRALDELQLPDALRRFHLVEPSPADPDPRRGSRRLVVVVSSLAIAVAGFLLVRYAFGADERSTVTRPSLSPGITTGAIPPHGSMTFDWLGAGQHGWSELAFIGPDGTIVPMTDAWSQRLVAGGAAWSPDGSRVAFVLGARDSWRYTGDGDLVVMNADGSDLRRLTHGIGATSPTWSPDGRRIAFVRNQGTALCTIAADGSDLRVIATKRRYYQHPRWSPTGDLILYQSKLAEHSEFGRTFVIHPDGTGERLLPRSLSEGSLPSWSPDGTRLAYADGVGISIFDLRTDRTVATLPHCDRCYGDLQPAWSPDGGAIAFAREDRRTRWSVFVFDIGTGKLTRVGPPGTQQSSPSWRP